MPLYRFPGRTNETDFGADVLGLALGKLVADRKPGANKHFMVSVVALQSKLMVVAISGSNRADVLTSLRVELSRFNDPDSLDELLLSKKARKTLEEKRKKGNALPSEKAILDVQPLVTTRAATMQKLAAAASAQPVLAAPDKTSDLSKTLVDPNLEEAKKRITAAKVRIKRDLHNFKFGEAEWKEVADAGLFAPGRWCAEPKALQLAYETGETVMGMTTFWHGPANAAEFAPYRDPDGPRAGLQLALPCDFCRANEVRIMAFLESTYNRQSMQTGRARRHSI